MDWLSALILGLAFSLAFIAWIRTVPKRRILTFTFLALPVIVLSMRWAAYRMSWAPFWLGSGLAFLFVTLWWVIYGHTLSPPEDGIQRVWTKDDPFE